MRFLIRYRVGPLGVWARPEHKTKDEPRALAICDAPGMMEDEEAQDCADTGAGESAQGWLAFKVVEARPEKRQMAQASTLDLSRDMISCVGVQLSEDESAEVGFWFNDTAASSGQCILIDLRALLTARPCMLSLVRIFPQRPSEVRASVPHRSCLPITGMSGDASLVAPGTQTQVLALGTNLRDQVSSVIEALRASDDKAPIPFLSAAFDGVSASTMDLLQREGIIIAEVDEFGDVGYSLEPSKVQWQVRCRLGLPRAASTVTAPVPIEKMGKLSLMLELKRQGWVELLAVPKTWLARLVMESPC